MISRACSLKGTQQVFLLNQQKANSCCRAYPQSTHGTTVQNLVATWQQEAIQLAQGYRLPDCQVCWDKEDQGLVSYRQLNLDPQPVQIELNLSNLCNHMCAYCSPKFSSKWQDSVAELGTFTKISTTAKLNQHLIDQTTDVEPWLNQVGQLIASYEKDQVVLNLLGGEPLMQHRVLEQAIGPMIDNVKQLVITTNLNPPSSRFLDMLLESCPAHKLTFNISIDAVPEFNHVPRAGFDQQRFENNLEKLISRGINFKFLCTISVLNVFDLDSFFSRYPNIQVHTSHLNNPSCLDIASIPAELHNNIIQNLPNCAPGWIVTELEKSNKTVDLKSREQYNYLTQYFARNNTVVPVGMKFGQYWTWLQQRFNNENSSSIRSTP